MSQVPPPLPPVPAAAHDPAPIPVQPLSYGIPVAQRPGIITALGTMSIIVGSLAILFNAGAGLQAFMFLMISQTSRAVAAVAVPPTPTPVPAPGGTAAATTGADASADPNAVADGADPDAMPKPDRDAVLAGLDRLRPLEPARRAQLDALLAKGGRRMFFGTDLTPQMVRSNVTDHGRLPAADGGDDGPDFFIIGQGRIEVADANAVFFPDGGGEAIRVDSSDAALVGWEQGLTPEQVDAVITEIQRQLATAGAGPAVAMPTLSPGQASQLRQTLLAPGQGFVQPSPTVNGAASQVTSVYASGDGNVNVTTQQGMINLDAKGTVLSSSTWAAAGPWGAAAAAAGGGPVFSVSATGAGLAIAGTIAGAALGIYLIVIGVLVLRQSHRGGRLHVVYAVLKIPVAVLTAVGLAWTWSTFLGNVAGAATGTAASTAMSGEAKLAAALLALFGCLYPIGVLIALRSRTVREYYAGVKPIAGVV